MIKFILHLRPKRIPEEALKFNVSYGLGGILTFLFFVEILTGILLMFYYSPSVNRAYFDVLKINNILPYGYILRNIHRFSGEFMIIIGFLHMCRVVFSEAIDTDVRKKNWIWGVFLFLLIFPLNFTGYLLPFDTISYWGATIVLNAVSEIPLIGKFLRYLISGSYGIDENVLLRFYVYHIVLLPLIFTLIMFVHFYKVRNAGGVKVRNFTKKVNISKLFKIEISAMLISLIFLIVICSKYYSAPLGNFALNSEIPEIIKAPWYFLNLQFLLKFISPLNILIILIFYVIFLIKFPEIKSKFLFIGIHFLFIVLIFLF